MFDEQRLYEIFGDMQEVLDLAYFRYFYLQKRLLKLQEQIVSVPKYKWLVFPNKQWHNVSTQIERTEKAMFELSVKIPFIENVVDKGEGNEAAH